MLTPSMRLMRPMEPKQNAQPDRRRLLTLGAILGVAAVTALAFARLFTGGVAWKLLLAAFAATALAAALERRSLLLASAASLLALIVAIGLLVFPHTTLFGLPTPETLRAIGSAAGRIGAAGARAGLPHRRRCRPCSSPPSSPCGPPPSPHTPW